MKRYSKVKFFGGSARRTLYFSQPSCCGRMFARRDPPCFRFPARLGGHCFFVVAQFALRMPRGICALMMELCEIRVGRLSA